MNIQIGIGETVVVKTGNKIKTYLVKGIFNSQIATLHPYNIKDKVVEIIKTESCNGTLSIPKKTKYESRTIR